MFPDAAVLNFDFESLLGAGRGMRLESINNMFHFICNLDYNTFLLHASQETTTVRLYAFGHQVQDSVGTAADNITHSQFKIINSINQGSIINAIGPTG